MATSNPPVDIPETPREQCYEWQAFVAAATLDEIERRLRNLFTPGRGWVKIGWYEHAWANSPEIESGLFLDDDPRNVYPSIARDDQSVTVRLTHSAMVSVGTGRVATEEEARKHREREHGRGDHQAYTLIEFNGGNVEGQEGRADRVKIEHRNTHGAVRHIVLVSQHDSRHVVAEREARVIEAVADRMQAEDESWGEHTGPEYVRGLAATIRTNCYPLTWEKASDR